ncbi:OsmC family protein [Taibaiella lutea]|uniref:OsmC family protein n=1 Tax=Taibaiella lutea TaxID=2608001 RepID=A0A5M6CDE7_9BACT|nr:OsmC family protein [Taibaiella lutea]KAA5532480.1 OsmC family protein [Taibaiella lutea]
MVHIKAAIGTQNYKTTITTGNHTIISDEPTTAGGEDLGFSPDELLTASLGACTAATLRMYANRKGWTELTGVEVNVTFNRLAGSSTMERTILLQGNITQEQKERLLYIANRCPIHQTLTHPIDITTIIS